MTTLGSIAPIRVVAYDRRWPALFAEQAAAMREHLGGVALRIDHIGSTAVPGLAAKPIVDLQISEAAFEPLDAFRLPLERAGCMFRADNLELTKRYFREAPASAAPMSTFAAWEASASSSRCCSATSCAPTRIGRNATRR
jgi:GrpB-like predicted nucleotidyltransferase (UPF0157 family)